MLVLVLALTLTLELVLGVLVGAGEEGGVFSDDSNDSKSSVDKFGVAVVSGVVVIVVAVAIAVVVADIAEEVSLVSRCASVIQVSYLEVLVFAASRVLNLQHCQ